MGLMEMINKQRKSEKKDDTRIVTEMSYPTGFLPLDYANGVTVTSYDDNDRVIGTTDIIGMVGGTKVTIIGISGTGKSALAVEIAASGIHKFGDKSAVQHADIELATSMSRPMKLLRIRPSLLKRTYEIYRDRAAEDIIDQFKSHCMIKIDNKKEFTYNTGVLDLYGEAIHELYPSALLIDSFAMFKSGKVDIAEKSVDDVTNNMIGAQAAKFNKGVLSQMLNYGKKANVAIISVNHINANVNTGFLPKPSQHMYLTQDESMPGGTATIFLANNIIKLKLIKKYTKSKSNDSQEYGFPGFLIDARLMKSRTNASNIPVELVFDLRRGGFSKIFTLLHFAFKENIILGSGHGYWIPGLEGVKFKKKTFEDEIYKHPEILQALYEACLPNLRAMLSTDSGIKSDDDSSSDRLDIMYEALEDHQKDVETYKKQGWLDSEGRKRGWDDFD